MPPFLVRLGESLGVFVFRISDAARKWFFVTLSEAKMARKMPAVCGGESAEQGRPLFVIIFACIRLIYVLQSINHA
jgi:hypothetical protein